MEDIRSIKQRFEIIGNDVKLDRAIEKAVQVAPTDFTVLITGESGAGKEIFPRIIHSFSARKHAQYTAVNCGAIPEGTIDSELFGHEKGSFTGALSDRKGYFEVSDGGTIFLDEVGELPLATQAKLLRVLEAGEFIRVGSSKVLKTDVRVVAATNVNLMYAVSKGKFREDLYYRLNAVPVLMPALRERQDDIYLLFRKFTSDFSEKYGMNKVSLTPEAIAMLKSYRWPGNIRQLKNVAETVTALESGRLTPVSGKCEIGAETLARYIPKDAPNMLPVKSAMSEDSITPGEKEAIVRMIYQLRQEVDYLKEIVAGTHAPVRVKALPHDTSRDNMPAPDRDIPRDGSVMEQPDWQEPFEIRSAGHEGEPPRHVAQYRDADLQREDPDEQDGSDLSLQRAGTDLIRKALEKYRGNRKLAASELGISERTLYRKLKSMEENQ